jgi:hypothetical protein
VKVGHSDQQLETFRQEIPNKTSRYQMGLMGLVEALSMVG